MLALKPTNTVGVVAAALVALFFFVFQVSHVVDFPTGDDFINLFTIAEKASAQGWNVLSIPNLTEQIYSHRPIAVRGIGALQVLLFGQLNFTLLVVFGIVCQIAAFGVICIGLYRGRSWSGWWITLLALIYFQPQLSGNFTMAMQGPVQLLPLAVACAFIFRQGAHTSEGWLLSWLCAGVASLAAINGVLVAPLLALWDLWDKRWKHFAGSVGLGMLGMLLYFWGYRLATHEGTGHDFALSEVIPGVFVMLGGVFTFGPLPLVFPMVFGALLFLISMGCAWHAFLNRRGFELAMILFLLGSIFMAALGRAGWGLIYMTQWRYTSLSLMLVLVISGYLLPWLARERKRLMVVGALVCAFSGCAWWQYAPTVVNQGRKLFACAMSWQLGSPSLFWESECGGQKQKEQLMSALDAGIFQLPCAAEATEIFSKYRIPVAAEDVVMRYDVDNAGYLATFSRPIEGDFVIFQEQSGKLRVAARAVKRFAVGRFLRGEPQDKSHTFVLPRTQPGYEVPAGRFLSFAPRE